MRLLATRCARRISVPFSLRRRPSRRTWRCRTWCRRIWRCRTWRFRIWRCRTWHRWTSRFLIWRFLIWRCGIVAAWRIRRRSGPRPRYPRWLRPRRFRPAASPSCRAPSAAASSGFRRAAPRPPQRFLSRRTPILAIFRGWFSRRRRRRCARFAPDRGLPRSLLRSDRSCPRSAAAHRSCGPIRSSSWPRRARLRASCRRCRTETHARPPAPCAPNAQRSA